MDYRASTSRYILTVLAIILVITTFILVGLNAFNIQGRFVTGKSYNDGFNAARAMYQKMCPTLGNRTETKSISGIVLSVNSGSLLLKQDSLDTNESVDGVSDTRTVRVSDSTKILKYEQKTPEQMQKGLEDFQKALQAIDQPARPPSPVSEKQISLSDINVGQRVTVTSDTDVRLEETITATRVSVQ